MKRRKERGASLVEFAVVSLVLFTLIFATVDMGRLILVYTSVANSARAGLRYAIVHGSTRTGSGTNGPSGPGGNPPEVVTVVNYFAGAGLADTTRLAVNVSYPDGNNNPGSRVIVSVVYPYDPLTSLFPVSVNLNSVTEGRIAF
ncbi:MAG: TadE/TadG family type IV pilus assembly protein [Bryobacteraceae bacterium]